MKQLPFIALTTLAILLVPAGRCHAEEIQLKSGVRIFGKIVSHGATALSMERDSQVVGVPYHNISRIEADEGSAYPQIEDLKSRWERVLRGEDAAGDSAETKKFVKSTTPRVELYMTQWCPYCRKMEAWLNRNGIKYSRYNVDYDQAARRRYEGMNGGGFPLLKIGDRIIRGYDTRAVERALR